MGAADVHVRRTTSTVGALVIGACVVVAVPIAAGRDQAPPPDAPPAFTSVCGTCHPPDRIVATRRSRDQWQEVIDNMTSRGAKGTDEEFASVMEFLVSHYGRVNVNRGLPDEMVEVLMIDPADAQKIADYRKAHGPFADMDALATVPGIDVGKLKEKRDAIVF